MLAEAGTCLWSTTHMIFIDRAESVSNSCLCYQALWVIRDYSCCLQGKEGNKYIKCWSSLNAERANLVCIDIGGAEWGVDVHYRVVKAFLVGTLLCESVGLISMPHRKSGGTRLVKYSKRNSMSVSLHTWCLRVPQDTELLISFSSSTKHTVSWQRHCEASLKGFMCRSQKNPACCYSILDENSR